VSSPLLPEVDEAEDLIILLILTGFPIGVAENSRLGVLGQEHQRPLLALASLGDVVLLDQRVLAMEGDRVEVKVERRTRLQAQSFDRVEPVTHESWIASWCDPATVLGERRSLRDSSQSSEEDQPFIEDGAHDVTVTGIAKKFAWLAESVGLFWLRKPSEVMQESQFCHMRRSKTIRLSCHQFHLVVEPLHSTSRDLAPGSEPVQN
jgi:hypothetical protein